jgi:hypothetical protein
MKAEKVLDIAETNQNSIIPLIILPSEKSQKSKPSHSPNRFAAVNESRADSECYDALVDGNGSGQLDENRLGSLHTDR